MEDHKIYYNSHKDYDIHLVNKRFGKGDLLIQFFYRRQVNKFKQGFIAYVDSDDWNEDKHSVMNIVENYLVQENGVIDDSYFVEQYDVLPNDLPDHYEEFLKDSFPMIDLLEGGVCYFDIANFDK